MTGAQATLTRRPQQTRRTRRTRRPDWYRYSGRTFYLFVSPWVLGFVLLTVLPLAYAFALSLTNFNLDEAGLKAMLSQRFGARADAIYTLYRRHAPQKSPYPIQAQVMTDSGFRRSAITQAQWRAVATALPAVRLSLNPDPSQVKDDARPVETVSWDEATEFCERLTAHTENVRALVATLAVLATRQPPPVAVADGPKDWERLKPERTDREPDRTRPRPGRCG